MQKRITTETKTQNNKKKITAKTRTKAAAAASSRFKQKDVYGPRQMKKKTMKIKTPIQVEQDVKGFCAYLNDEIFYTVIH